MRNGQNETTYNELSISGRMLRMNTKGDLHEMKSGMDET